MLDLLCVVCKHCLFSHDYVQMEKEEGSFVRAEVSSHFELSPLRLKLEYSRAVWLLRHVSLTVIGMNKRFS